MVMLPGLVSCIWRQAADVSDRFRLPSEPWTVLAMSSLSHVAKPLWHDPSMVVTRCVSPSAAESLRQRRCCFSSNIDTAGCRLMTGGDVEQYSNDLAGQPVLEEQVSFAAQTLL